jgi:hypothetical protein
MAIKQALLELNEVIDEEGPFDAAIVSCHETSKCSKPETKIMEH